MIALTIISDPFMCASLVYECSRQPVEKIDCMTIGGGPTTGAKPLGVVDANAFMSAVLAAVPLSAALPTPCVKPAAPASPVAPRPKLAGDSGVNGVKKVEVAATGAPMVLSYISLFA
jgi:hypothetical protein